MCSGVSAVCAVMRLWTVGERSLSTSNVASPLCYYGLKTHCLDVIFYSSAILVNALQLFADGRMLYLRKLEIFDIFVNGFLFFDMILQHVVV